MPDIVKVTVVANCAVPTEDEAESQIRRRFGDFLPSLRTTGFGDARVESVAFEDAEPEAVEEEPEEEAEDLSDLTKAELYDLAQEQDIAGRSSMSKAELVEALS